MNSHATQLRRLLPANYADGISALAENAAAGPREISNAVAAQNALIPNSLGASDFFWQWGQFLDHDLDLTDGVNPAEHVNIPVPAGDIWFDPQGSTPEDYLPPIPEWNTEGWGDWQFSRSRVRAKPCDVIENIVDIAHFPHVHGGFVKSFENRFTERSVTQSS